MVNEVVTLKMPEKMQIELLKIGERDDRSKAWLIRRAVQRFLEENKKIATDQ